LVGIAEAVIVKRIIRHDDLIIVIHQRGCQQEIGGGPVAGKGDIPGYGQTEKGLDIGVMRLRFHGVPEEDKNVDLSFGYTGADLLVTAERAAEVPGDGLSERLLYERAGGAGAEELVFGEGALIIDSPLDKFGFFVVVSYEGYPFGAAHFPDGSLHVGKIVAF
jgi:hypothetical protein